jgi:hypothetical protein
MANFNLEDYEPVEERLARLYEKHPDARVQTELVTPLDSLDKVVFRASIYLNGDESPKATGYAMEEAGKGYVNKTSHLENCETSAIGRALANMGMHGNKRPSREEMQKARQESDTEHAYKLTAQYIQESGLSESMRKGYAKELEAAYEGADITTIRAIYKRVKEAKEASDE